MSRHLFSSISPLKPPPSPPSPGKQLVRRAVAAMAAGGADEAVLEAEAGNAGCVGGGFLCSLPGLVGARRPSSRRVRAWRSPARTRKAPATDHAPLPPSLSFSLSALRVYESLGFLRDKRLLRYYLNGADAFRLKLLLPEPDARRAERAAREAAAAEREEGALLAGVGSLAVGVGACD